MTKHGTRELGGIWRALANNRWFGSLPENTLHHLAAMARLRTYALGEQLNRHGAPAAHLWVVVAGFVKVVNPSADGTGHTIAVLGPDALFAADAFVEGARMQFEGHAEVTTTTIQIDARSLRALARRDEALCELVPRLLVDHAATFASNLADVLAQPLPRRLARRLVGLAPGMRSQGTPHPDVDLSQSSLAEMLGVSRTRLNRELRALERDGLIELMYRRVRICDIRGLEHVARGGA